MFISIITENKISSADIEYMKNKVGVGLGFAIVSANHIIISDNFTMNVEKADVISISVKSVRDYFEYKVALAA